MFSSNTSQVVATSTQAEAVDFDGTNDYLSRSSDLVGNADGKTFTFSAWVYTAQNQSNDMIYSSATGSVASIYCWVDQNGQLIFWALASNGSTFNLRLASANFALAENTFNNVLISIDMANTSNRYVYVNDVNITSSITFTNYVNTNLRFSQTKHSIGVNATNLSSDYLPGRLSNVFLDYTYRDLSVEANRRLFITADLKPAAGQAALNPILYLPMSDPTTVGTNAGTGGNFTLTGTIARSGRGPNQYNAPYSDLDGAADYLSRTTAPTGIADGKQFTFSCTFNTDDLNGKGIFVVSTSSTDRFRIFGSGTTTLRIRGLNAAGTLILNADIATGIVAGRNYQLVMSVDLADAAKRFVYLNGTAVTATWYTYTNDSLDFAITTSPRYDIGYDIVGGGTYWNGRLGAIWFNTSYIDLSVASNLAKFVSGTGIDAKPVDLGATGELPTGTSPLIYLPLYGNNAGKNYGTGGDFTVNSGPYTGARGPNEFWGNKANFGATASNYLSRSTELVGNPGNVTTATFCCYFYCNDAATTGTLFGFDSAASGTWQISANRVFVWLGSGYVEFNENVTSSAWHSLLFSRTGSTITAYLDGVALTINSGSSFDYGGAINFAQTPVNIGVRKTGLSTTDPMNGQISELYLSSSYIDFSQEANRLKFRDCFGNPVDLSAQITAQSIPTPIVYARFPPTSFGTNSGTGGDFTKTGTITDGGQL